MHKLKHKQNSHSKAQSILSRRHESATKFSPASPVFKSRTLPTDAYSRRAVPRYCSSSAAMSFKATLSLYSGSYSLITTQKLVLMAYLLSWAPRNKQLREVSFPKLIKCSLPFAYHRRLIHCGTELYSNAYLLHWTAYPQVNVLLSLSLSCSAM